MSEDVENRTTSKTSLNNPEAPSISTSGTRKTSSNSAQSLKCPHSRSLVKLNNESTSSTSASSAKSKPPHYITLVQPRSVSCSLKSVESDKTVQLEENVEYSRKLRKELNIRNESGKSKEENSSELDEIPLTVLAGEELSNASGKHHTNKTSVKILSGPRMTTSDSFISINRKYLQDNERKHVLPTEAEVKTWEKPSSSEKPTVFQIQNVESDQTSSVTPVSIFENEKYKTFTDSNSHDDDIIESIRTGNGRKKSTTVKVDFKKGIELKNSSLLSIPSTVCRICHANTVNERLLSPCYCKGSLAYVHLSCLERWLNQSSRSYCELCLYQYNAVETLRYGFFEGIRLWVRHPRNRNHVRSDCLIAFLLTLVTLGLVVICLIGMDYFMIEGIKLGLSRMWTKSFIVSFLGVIMMGYVVTMYLIVKDQFVPWYTWWKNTLNIRLLLSPTVTQTQRI